jgi:hypothetical protein
LLVVQFLKIEVPVLISAVKRIMANKTSFLTVNLPMPTSPLMRQTAAGGVPISPISRLSSLGSNTSVDSEDTIDLARSQLIALLQHLRRLDIRINKRLLKSNNTEESRLLQYKKENTVLRIKKTLELLELL